MATMALLPLLLLLLLATVGAHAAAGPFVTDGDRVPPHSIRVTTLGSGSPDVRRHQARSKDARALMRLGEFLLNRIGTNCSACMQVASGFLIELGNGDKFIWDLGSGSYVRYACMHGMPLANPELQRAGVGCSHKAHALMHHCVQVNLVATGVPQAQLTKVFLSHLHSDHIADLASLVRPLCGMRMI